MLEPVLASVPSVRQVFDWDDVEWGRLTFPQKAQARPLPLPR